MYITLQSTKRNLGLFNFEIQDLIISFSFAVLFIILFIMKLYTTSFLILALGILAIVPIDFNKCNRIYKLIFLSFQFIIKNKNYSFYN